MTSNKSTAAAVGVARVFAGVKEAVRPYYEEFVVLPCEALYFEELLASVSASQPVPARICAQHTDTRSDKVLLFGLQALESVARDKSWRVPYLGVFNTEQLTRPEIRRRFIHGLGVLNPGEVLDYSPVNIEIIRRDWKSSAATVRCVPFVPCPLVVDRLRELIAATPKRYDFAVLGTPSARRSSAVAKMQKLGFTVLEVHSFGEERDLSIASCRVLINIHFDTNYRVFEQSRCTRWMEAGMQVLTDECDEWWNTAKGQRK